MYLLRIKHLTILFAFVFILPLVALFFLMDRYLKPTDSMELGNNEQTFIDQREVTVYSRNVRLHDIDATNIKDSKVQLFNFSEVSPQNCKRNLCYPIGETSNKFGYEPSLYNQFFINPRLKQIKPFQTDLGDIVNDVESFKYPINVFFPSTTTKLSCDENVGLVLLIVSAPKNFEKRQLIRKTWASKVHSIAKTESTALNSTIEAFGYAFFIGEANSPTLQMRIVEESENHGDIIQVNITDDYKNLTLKSVAIISWLHKYCSSAKFTLKVDDDVYVNLFYLTKMFIDAIGDETYLIPSIYGAQVPEHNPDRNPDSRHYVDMDTWPWSSFPSYVFGGCYMISQAAILPLLKAAQSTPYFLFEDLYITALCARKAGLKVMTNERMFFMKSEVPDVIDRCFAQEGITWETKSSEDMINSHLKTQEVFDGLENRLPFDYEFCASLMTAYENESE